MTVRGVVLEHYEWLDEAMQRATAVCERLGVPWEFTLGPPASADALDAAERSLGFALPPSLRALYVIHDGGTFGMFRVPDVGDLVRTTLRDISEALEIYDESAEGLLSAIDLGDGNWYKLDAAAPDGRGEYPVLDAFHETGPSVWRDTVKAPSFGAWLRSTLDDVAAERDPFDGRALYENWAGLTACLGTAYRIVSTDPDRARRYVLRGFAHATIDEPSSSLSAAAKLFSECGIEHRGDALLARIFTFLAKARTRDERGEPRTEWWFIDALDPVMPLEHFRARNGRDVPEEMLGIMRAYTGFTLFMRERYAEDAGAMYAEAALRLHGGADHGLRRDLSADAPPDAVCIGTIGGDSLLMDATDAVWRRSVRRAPDAARDLSPDVKRVRLPSTEVGELQDVEYLEYPPVRIAPSLTAFIDEAFANRRAGRPPYDLGPIGAAI